MRENQVQTCAALTMYFNDGIPVKFKSIETKLIAVLLCATLAPAVAIGWIAQNVMFEEIKNDRIADVGIVASTKHDQLARLLSVQNDRAQALLAHLNSLCLSKAGVTDKPCAAPLLQSYLVAEGALGATLQDKAGIAVSAGEPGNFAAGAFKPGQLAGFAGTGKEKNRSYYVSAGDDSLQLQVNYPTAKLESIFIPYPSELGESGETFLADGEGYFVTTPKYAATQGHQHPISARPMQLCLSGKNSEVLDLDYRNAQIIHGFRFVPEFGSACIMAHITQDEAFAPLRLLERHLVTALLGFLLILTAFVVYLVKRIIRPVNALTEVARKITAGDYQQIAAETGADELAALGVSFNIMTRKFRDSQQLFQSVVENIPVMVFLKRADDLRIALFNRAGQELTGYPAEVMLGKGNDDLWTKEEAYFFTAVDRKVLASTAVTEIPEEPITTASGQIRYLHTWKTALRDASGRPTYLLGISVDITETKRMQAELDQHRSHLQALVDAQTLELRSSEAAAKLALVQLDQRQYAQDQHSIVAITDVQGNIQYVNDKFCDISGYSREELLGQDHILLNSGHQPHGFFKQMYQSIAHGIVWHGEICNRAKDGHLYWVDTTIVPMLGENGKPQQYIAIRTDITALKTASELLRDNTERISAILNTVADGIITINEQGIVETFNPAAERIFGYEAIEVIGHNINMLMPEPYHHQHDGYLERYRATGVARVIGKMNTVEGRRRDGSTFPMELAVGRMQLGEGRFFTGIVRDITERQQIEQKLIAAKVMAEQANHAKDSFLSTMSHEIRTPLTGMLGMLELLSLSLLELNQQKTLQTAWDSARSLLRIVNDILDWSRIQEGKLALAPQSTSIPQLLQEVVSTYSHISSAKNLNLWQHSDARLSAAHIVDPLRLAQVLNNFVSNAIKFTQRGEIELRAEFIESLESGERIRFSVKDTGIGIPREIQESVFNRYQQASADTARQYGGTGLGLAICRRLADLLDGKIELISVPGKGSTFSLTVILPISAAPVEAIPSLFHVVEQRTVKPLISTGGVAPLVLAVDDHPTNRDLLARQIEMLGLRAETAENGNVALSKWREGRFALVITDCHMPEMDGYALTRAIRQIEAKQRLTRTPVIAWTANALPGVQENCHDAGMDELLVKPTDLTLLKRTLAKWLSLSSTEGAPTSTPPFASDAQRAGPVDYAELGKIVPGKIEQLKVLHDFRSHMQTDMAKLAGMLADNDTVNIERTAHRMKGSCRMVGAKDMADACASIEQAAKNGELALAAAAMTGLVEAFKEFEIHLSAHH